MRTLKAAAVVMLAGAAGLAGCLSILPFPPDETGTFRDTFTLGLINWQIGKELPNDPNNPGNPVASVVETSTERASVGERSVRMFIDGRQDDGTIWIARAFQGAQLQNYRVRLRFDFWSPSESFNVIAAVAAYAGPREPATESDFNLEKQANLAEGWREYEYIFDVRSGASGLIWVATGISVRWETEMTYFLDNVRIEIEPR